jgi:hypothetical protein
MPLQGLALGRRMAAAWGGTDVLPKGYCANSYPQLTPFLILHCSEGYGRLSTPGSGRATHDARAIIGLQRLRDRPLLGRVQQQKAPIAIL